MKTADSLGWGVLTISLCLAGCQGKETKGSAEKQYPIQGKVIALNPEKLSVKLEHEDIPGLMQGMTMEFAVPNAQVLEGLKPGDAVRGGLKVESGKYIITHLERQG